MAKAKDQNLQNDSEIKDTTPSNIPSVDLTEETIETIVGRIVKLAPHRAVWRSEKKGIDMSCFTGIVTARVTNDLTEFEKEQVLAGLKYNSIVFTEVEETHAPANLSYDISDDAMKARVFLDNPSDELFKKELDAIRSIEFISKAIIIYENEYRNKPRLSMLKERLNKL